MHENNLVPKATTRRRTATLAAVMRPQLEDTKPYGASSLKATDQEKFTRSMAIQIRGLSPVEPQLNLFPSASASKTGKTYLPNNPHKSAHIVGINSRDMNYFFTIMNKPPFNQAPHCLQSAFEKDAKADVVASALHEVTHYVAGRLGLDNRVLDSLRSKRTPEVDLENVRERIGDASAVLYMLSNYGNSSSVIDEVHWRTALRAAMSLSDTEHTTSSSMAAAVDAFKEHPQRGLSIVETTRWAANIVAQQPIASFDVNPQNIAFEMTHKVTGFTGKDLADGERALQQDLAARNFMCRITPSR